MSIHDSLRGCVSAPTDIAPDWAFYSSAGAAPLHVITLYDSQSRQAAIGQQLRRHGVHVEEAASIGDLRGLIRLHTADAVLLEDSGAALADSLATIRLRVAPDLPLFAVGTPNGIGIVEALTHGACDYLDRDMSAEQIVARLRAHANGKVGGLSPVMRVGQFTLSEATNSIRLYDAELSLTPREFALAKILFAGVGRVVPLSSLSARVWGVSVELSKRTLEQHVYKLRRKLKACFREGVRIQAAYGIGYRLDLVVSVSSELAARNKAPEVVAHADSVGAWTGVERRRSGGLGAGGHKS